MTKCHCGQYIPAGHGYKKKQKYCSYSCLTDKPPKVLELEVILGKNIKSILTEYKSMNNSIQTKADLLGITRQTYYKYVKQYI